MTVEEYISFAKRRIKNDLLKDVKYVHKSIPKVLGQKDTCFVGFKFDHWIEDRSAVHEIFGDIEKIARSNDKLKFWFYIK